MNNKENLKTIVLWWLGTFIALILIIFNTIFYELLKSSFYTRVQNSLSIVSHQVKEEFIPINSQRIVTIPQKLEFPISPVMIAVLGAKKMKIIAKTVVFLDIKMYPYLKSDENFFIVQSKKYGKIAIYISRIISPIKGYIVVATPMQKVDIKLEDIFIKMIILNPILLLLLLLGANVILDRILNPIKEITKTANDICIGKLDKTLPVPTQNDEIQELVKAFNSMVIRLKSGIEMMERFNSDVSHELKTPLTVLKGELEIALRKDRDIEYYKNTIKTALNEVNYLIDMVEEMLIFTKLDSEANKNENIKVDEMVLNLLSKFSRKAKLKNINIEIQKLDMCELHTNPILLQTTFVNIIDNAIKYTPENKNIYISLINKDKEIEFIVEDEGIGISKEDIKNITDRFYRSELSRNREIKGFGLGLSIVKKCLEILNGDIFIESELNKGTKIKIVIKK